MHKLLFTISILITYSFYGQADFSSFYFEKSQPEYTPSIFEFQNSFTGSYYKKNDSLIRVIVEKDSIYTEFGILFIISPKEIKKNKNVTIKDSLIHGIQPSRGIPFKIIEDTIYAVLIQQDLLFKPDSNHILKQQDDTYFLNSKNKKGFFSTRLLTFEKDTLMIKEIDHLVVFNLIQEFQILKETQENNMKYYIANPTTSELNLFIKKQGFSELLKYHL